MSRSLADAAATSCTRDGSLDALERAVECAVACTDPADPKLLRVTLETNAPKVVSGGMGAVVLKIRNVGQAPATICLRMETSEPVGWDRLAGVPQPKPDAGCDKQHFSFPLRTLDGRDASVDHFKVGANVICSRTVRSVLPPGRVLSKTLAWPAIRLPAAPRPWEDDAGHRYYPKVVPVPLSNGKYRIETEVPFASAPDELRRVSTIMEVGND